MSEVLRPGRGSLTGRLLGLFALVFLVVLVVFSAVVTNTVRTVLQRQITDDLAAQARVAAVGLADEPTRGVGAEIAEASGARLTIIGSDGVVLFDSVDDAATMENHAARPEVAVALAGGEGTDFRRSSTTGAESLYVAVPTGDGRVLRLAVTAAQLEADLSQVGASVLAVAAVAGVAGVILVWTVAGRFTRPIRELTDLADQVAAGKLVTKPRRSTLSELDRLGLSIGRISSELGRTITEIEAQRRTLDAVLGALPQGVILVGGDDSVVYSNATASSMVGGLPDRLTAVTPRALHRAVRDARASGAVQEVAFERGSPARAMSVTATRLADDDRVVAVISDVTERMRVEAMRRDFVADASHELKTPVASVLVATEAMQLALDRDPAKAAEFAGRVEAAARQLATIVTDLLDLSRLETSDPPFAEVDLAAVVEDEVAKVAHRAEEAGVVLAVHTVPSRIMGSSADLALAVRNLIDNAVRYTDEGGSVRVELSEGPSSVRVSVQDTGSGIPQRALGRVFERFYRVDEARSRATGGTGLGLAIVRHVVERHGGSVTVTSQLGSGSRFVMELPRAVDHPESVAGVATGP